MAYNMHCQVWEMAAAKKAIAKVAQREGKTVKEIRTAMMATIQEAYSNPDPVIKARWANIPCAGKIPTPEELIIWVSKRI